MKSKILTFFLLIILVVLFGFLAFVGFAIYSNLSMEDVIESAKSTVTTASLEDANKPEKTKRNKDIGTVLTEIFSTTSEEVPQYSVQSSSGKFFYEQLTDNQKKIYNGLQENKDNMISGTYVIEYGNLFSDILEQEGGIEKLQDDYQTVVEAFTHDNVDMFYLDVSKMYLNIETIKKVWNTTYNVFIAPPEGKNYYENGYQNEIQVKAIKNQIESIKQSIQSNFTKDKYKNIKYIHDFLINNVEYDQTYNSEGTYNIYGALVKRKCVCDGYARAFKYLANAAGIECELIQGIATNSSGKTETHAWNVVLLDGKWYYIDVTWDDPIIIGEGYVKESYHYTYFLKGERTLSKDHEKNGQFTENGKIFSYPVASNIDY